MAVVKSFKADVASVSPSSKRLAKYSRLKPHIHFFALGCSFVEFPNKRTCYFGTEKSIKGSINGEVFYHVDSTDLDPVQRWICTVESIVLTPQSVFFYSIKRIKRFGDKALT